MISSISKLLRIRFVQDAATLQIGKFVGISCGMVTSIAYINLLGIGGYGKYAIVMAFAGIFGIVTNLGQQATLTTFFSRSYGQQNKREMTQIAQYYLYTSIAVAIFLLILALFMPTISGIIYKDNNIGKLARLVFFSSIFEFGFSYVSILLQITREIKILAFLENTKIVLQVSLAILLLWLGFGIAGILYSSLSISILFFIVSIGLNKWINSKYPLPRLKEILAKPNWKQILKYNRAGIWIAVDKNVGNLYPTAFLFVLSLSAPESIVGLFRLAFKLAGLPTSFALSSISRMAGSVIPSIAGKDIKSLKSTLIKLAMHSVFIHTAITIAGMILVPIFLPYVYGENMGIAVYPFLAITAMQLSLAVHVIMTPIFRLKNKSMIPAIINSIGMAISISVFFILAGALTETRALYVSIFLYHLISLSAVFFIIYFVKEISKKSVLS
ncbi:oligosaccharide flippase family protein [Candidatus Peregrinibacteria bacterium]|jgi:O-antigen/teichoic acid export membrane protein|nr:oligosaccharide flippase family protein [Candidatus Peregrinibacteria bacterium]MBT3598683.1 oligosaccharide flippase family protein [Candidatus Peregrinibacteria bacterium]MBT4366990.1 oligosaccharide flippase family protein [Candidatus Peregrinibacteria bacterium]MBT4586035.1 oligosaccharide flippase family protein [Candidatus Peregrinibacteria bacterium]MBT6730459.1 oligosaccharide flippase family protein [Candidatus Peregrinibacteria bacterium]